MDLGKYKLPFASSNVVIWAIVIFIILGFGNNCDALGFNLFGGSKGPGYGNGKNYGNGYSGRMVDNRNHGYQSSLLGGSKGFLGGNGLFLLALVAIIFICKDDKKTHDYGEEVIGCEPIVEE
ncbi:hypothetical protein [Clostridium oryzae]|uniref:Uncharacterized protein n=1 Tax=Clostridium oryzae TaxID=1450648 RepID=A0A1V4I725_9CLOT|nr:hypothetical protein [Clostridium oryzae]OPJ55347.1 hypothetical protein CLORY_44390 [Clostridium oryzae]